MGYCVILSALRVLGLALEGLGSLSAHLTGEPLGTAELGKVGGASGNGCCDSCGR
jgi:hypothetical protein